MFDSINLSRGNALDRDEFTAQLIKIGYTRREGIAEQGDFTVRGEAILIYPATFEYPVRIELADDRIGKIVSIDRYTFKSIYEHSAVIIIPIQAIGIRKRKIWNDEDPIDVFVDLAPGDYVVHIDYGIGKYLGNRLIRGKKGMEEKAAIEYEGGDVLYVSIDELNKVQKYIYFQGRRPKLHKLGGRIWQRVKDRAAKGVFKVAHDILEVQAKRESMKGFSFSKDTDWQKDMEALFPFKETLDQLTAAGEVKQDMEGPRPMDRLLCGDVGYGKTEVALRAAFKAVMDNKQAAILVPTTILAEQHYNTFSKRLKTFPVKVEMLSRFRTKGEQEAVVEGLKAGHVDIVIGTHRLLSPDIAFKDLGLVIIDEEQRFGVRHKERLKRMRLMVDVLTLTATPIPRTLYLALMGGRDISIINTPPLERQPVETHVVEFREDVVRDAIQKELDRGGQVFFIHNRIETIGRVARRVLRMVPEARLSIGHGRMSEAELEKTMIDFIDGKTDVLISTTIVESGIDIPNANTLIVDNAEHFGMADLYQLRGRVGRFNRKAYAYFIVNHIGTLTHDEQKRLLALKKMTALGSGFKIALQDLELRGAGNLLGVEQSGYIEQVGFDLYCRLLRSAIGEIKAQE
ncbi:MAG: helicase-related protein [Candidatus Omnitrophica bacterium]|nr:helicase-related protein [Candidatus Omnitrophota bacterium]